MNKLTLAALLLSTMIPCLINLVIGRRALVRSVPGLSPWLLNYLRPLAQRALVTALVTEQMAINVILGVAAIRRCSPYDHVRSRRWTVLMSPRTVPGAEPTTRGVRFGDSQLTDTMVEYRSLLPSLPLGR
jgi:hypothetical protein